MKRLSNFILGIEAAVILLSGGFLLINLIILVYGILQMYPAAQITLLFLCLVAGFGTDHWRKRKLNNRIKNIYGNV